MINTLKELVSIKSIAEPMHNKFPYGPGPAAALDYVLNICKKFGFRTKNANGLYGYAEIGSGDELIGILCHLDVVPAGNDWTYPPFDCTIANGRIYGRGTIDDKGPTVACIFAMKELLETTHITKRIRIIFGQTEENGVWTDIEKYKENEEIPDYGFTPDGDFPAIYCEKGILLVKVSMPLSESGLIEIDGGKVPNMVPDFCYAKTEVNSYHSKGCAAHGSAPWNGKNAITSIMKKIAADENVLAIPFAYMYNSLFADSFYGEKLGYDFKDKYSGKLSLNPGKVAVENGYVCLYLDIRYPISVQQSEIVELLNSKVSLFNAVVSVVHQMPPVYLDMNSKTMEKLLSAYRLITSDESEPLVIGGGTYARAMDNIIAFGPNFPGHENREHNCDEYISEKDFYNLFLIYKQALKNLLD